MKKILLFFILLLFSGCGNQWYKRYTGVKLPSTKDCYVKIAYEKNYLEKLTENGYEILGSVNKEYTNRHERYVINACKRIGADFAVYDNINQRMYFIK